MPVSQRVARMCELPWCGFQHTCGQLHSSLHPHSLVCRLCSRVTPAGQAGWSGCVSTCAADLSTFHCHPGSPPDSSFSDPAAVGCSSQHVAAPVCVLSGGGGCNATAARACSCIQHTRALLPACVPQRCCARPAAWWSLNAGGQAAPCAFTRPKRWRRGATVYTLRTLMLA